MSKQLIFKEEGKIEAQIASSSITTNFKTQPISKCITFGQREIQEKIIKMINHSRKYTASNLPYSK